MSFKSRASKKLKKVANKLPQVKMFKKAKSMFSQGGEGGDDEGMRGEAAKRLVNRNQQAGSGQVNFNTEEYV